MLGGAVVTGVLVGAGVIGALMALRGDASPPAVCAPDIALAPHWNADVRARVAAAFASAGSGDASAFTSAVEQWTGTWQGQATATCTAVANGTEPPELHARRRQCLTRRLSTLDAAIELVLHADRSVAVAAPRSVDDLPELARCGDLASLAALPPEPAAGSASTGARRKLDVAEAAIGFGLHPLVIDNAGAALAQLGALDDRALRYECNAALGIAEAGLERDPAGAADQLWTTIAIDPTRADDVAIRVWITLASAVGEAGGLPEQGVHLAGIAESMIRGPGHAELDEGELDLRLAVLLVDVDRSAEAHTRLLRAEELFTRTHDARRLSTALAVEARLLSDAHHGDEAVTAFERALAASEAAGAPLIDRARLLDELADAQRDIPRWDAALASDHRALDLVGAAPDTAAIVVQLRAGIVQSLVGKGDVAGALREGEGAIAFAHAELPKENALEQRLLVIVGELELRAGTPEAALEALQDAERIYYDSFPIRRKGDWAPPYAMHTLLARAFRLTGHTQEMIVAAEHAAELAETADGVMPRVDALTELAEAQWLRGDRAAARLSMEQVVLELVAVEAPSPALVARAQVARAWQAAHR